MKLTRDCATSDCCGFFMVTPVNGRRKYCDACLSDDWHAQHRAGKPAWRKLNNSRAKEWRARNQEHIQPYRAARYSDDRTAGKPER